MRNFQREEYRRIIQELNMELTFMRHLIELRRIGLIDANAIYNTMMVLRDRDKDAKCKAEEEARFYFVEELRRMAELEATDQHMKQDPGRPMC